MLAVKIHVSQQVEGDDPQSFRVAGTIEIPPELKGKRPGWFIGEVVVTDGDYEYTRIVGYDFHRPVGQEATDAWEGLEAALREVGVPLGAGAIPLTSN